LVLIIYLQKYHLRWAHRAIGSVVMSAGVLIIYLQKYHLWWAQRKRAIGGVVMSASVSASLGL